jgi:hypothetical protein
MGFLSRPDVVSKKGKQNSAPITSTGSEASPGKEFTSVIGRGAKIQISKFKNVHKPTM